MIDKKFVKRLKQGDPKALKKLYDIYAPSLYGLALRYSKNEEEAQDILQEAFIKIFKYIHTYEEKGKIESWMKKIVINTAIANFHKQKKHRFQQEISEINETNIENFSLSEPEFTMDELLNAIQSLPVGYRTIFNLYAIEGYKHREIAKMLGIDISTSKSQYHRARKLLQKKLLELKNFKKTNG